MTSKELFNLAFELGNPIPFKYLPEKHLFVFPHQLEDEVSWRSNKYWKIKENGYKPYMSPNVYNKESGEIIQKYMTDYPVPSESVDSTKS